ncbi:hypothetical protein [Micromonospora echinaurantiaca]|uniref:hypothetical protein n=1 Tax=Micromonospora echinaurantiaca TaxID=47857 RepID=UPI00342FABDF
MHRQTLLRTPVVVLAAALVVSGCSSGGTSDTKATATTTVTEAPADAPAPPSDAAATATPAARGTTDAGSTGGGSTGRPDSGSTTGAPRSAGPTIDYFRVARKPSCPAGTSANPIPGTPVTVEWKVGNVDSVALSVDGPGVYADNLPPTGSETLTFPCSGAEGDVQRHTYLLTVRNSSGKRTKTLVVSATVHDIPEV